MHVLPWIVRIVGLLAPHMRHSLLNKHLDPPLPDGRNECKGEGDQHHREHGGADRMIEERDEGRSGDQILQPAYKAKLERTE